MIIPKIVGAVQQKILIDNFHFMDQLHDGSRESIEPIDLHGLLSQDPIRSWGPIYKRIQGNPHEVQERYYRNESCFQLALKATEQCDSSPSIPLGTGGCCKHVISRIDVLQAIVDADPSAIHWRDDEGRTSLHTASSSGRSFDILQWLLGEEEAMIQTDGAQLDRNATLRTDFPGGGLALHAVAACTVFDDLYFRTSGHAKEYGAAGDDSMYSMCLKQLSDCPVKVKIVPQTLSAFASTWIIIQANPKAISDRDCEGEIPLHGATSFGNIGSVVALLDAEEGTQALALNDRQKSPLSLACERVVAFSVHRKDALATTAAARRSEQNSLRISINRDDPFGEMDGISGSRLRVSTSHRDRGSSVRSSLSTSFVLSGGRFGNQNSDTLRYSFTSPRKKVHPVFGLETLDEDGEEELTKVELLTMAACGLLFAKQANDHSSKVEATTFYFLHELIKLDQPPEVIWHAACKNPLEVTTKDASGSVPLFLACQRLARAVVAEDEDEPVQLRSTGSADSVDGDSTVKDNDVLPDEYNSPSSIRRLSVAPQHQVSFAIDIINMLLQSQEFGSKEMASISSHERLPLHTVLETVQWTDHEDDERPHPIKSLIDAYPHALETRDSVTGLYPFMIAASSKFSNRDDKDLSTVETVYRLLLESPAVISLCLNTGVSH